MSDTNKTALVLGATGGIGGSLTEQLLARGWTIRALTRDPARAAKGRDSAIQWIQGDAMDRAAVVAAAEGCSLVVHAVNPPGYRDWDKLVLPMMDNAIATRILPLRVTGCWGEVSRSTGKASGP